MNSAFKRNTACNILVQRMQINVLCSTNCLCRVVLLAKRYEYFQKPLISKMKSTTLK